MWSSSELWETARALLLAGGLVYAAVRDLQSREVTDRLWQLLGIVGFEVGAIRLAPDGALPLVLWVVVGVLALEQLLPWDDALGEEYDRWVLAIELGAFAAVIATVAASAVRWGISPTAVPVGVVAALATVVLARALFELGVLYGGADAKALMVTGILLPIFASPVLLRPATLEPLLLVLPFSINVLTDAALLSVFIPLVIAARNVARGEFSFPRGFTSYTLPVAELPERFVWVRDDDVGEDSLAEDAADTSEDDRRVRTEIAQRLQQRGVQRVWVTPQLPFLVLLAAGAVAAFLAGNLLLDIFAAL